MSMEVIEKTPEKLILRLESSDSLANAVRRSVEEVPTLAIDEIEFFKNDSALYNEFLAHRIGLVPLKTEGKMSAKTSIDLKLVKSGEGPVYSGDLQGGAKIVYDNIPLTILRKGQEIELIANAKLGTGIEHTKHTPGLVYYRHILEVESKNPKVEEIVKNSDGLVKPEKKGSKWICDLSEADVDKILDIEKDCVGDSNEILLFVESFGLLDAKDIVSKAVQKLNENLDSFEKSLK